MTPSPMMCLHRLSPQNLFTMRLATMVLRKAPMAYAAQQVNVGLPLEI